MDERFIIHRLKATRLAAVVGVVMMCAWMLYYFYTRHVVRWDLLIILWGIAVTKLCAMAYYRKRN